MKLLTSWPLGLRLWQRGRMCLGLARIPRAANEDLRRMLEVIESSSGGAAKSPLPATVAGHADRSEVKKAA
jgi:hypothetical protein